MVVRAERVLLGGRFVERQDVHVAGGRIVDIRACGGLPAGARLLDRPDATVVPGFLDGHVHGHGSCGLIRAPYDVAGLAGALARHGVTGFLATTVSATPEALDEAVRHVVQHAAPGCLGVHLEGPWLAPSRAGAQPPEALRAPEVHELEALAVAGPVRLVTLAPELAGSAELLAAAGRLGIAVSLGHTDAPAELCREFVTAGAGRVTHCFNAMRGAEHRAPGLAALALDPIGVPDLLVEVIADGEHVHPVMVRALFAARGADGVCIVSDGVSDGVADALQAPGPRAGAAVRRADGRLAGSTAMLDAALQNLISWGIAPVDALRAMTATPARGLGRPDLGGLEVGGPADLVVLDGHWSVRAVVAHGRLLDPPPA
ncbi:MAG TPA: amidohydrolase family protein [Mycobacteriales bacterium]|nr:amidohydrolase family protein [Mycobacteriales bacterium]